MKICLIRPPAVESFRFATTSITPPLGLAYIAAALQKAGYRPYVVDAVAKAPQQHRRYMIGFLVGLPLEDIVEAITSDTDMVGITCVFTHEWPAVAQLTRLIRARHPNLRIVLGGEHVTSMAEFSLAISAADVVVMGEGEETIIELLAAIRSKALLSQVAGIAYREGGVVQVNVRRPRRLEVDAIAWPAWDLFELHTYHANHFFGGMYSRSLTVPILATRGCPYQCTYCSAPNMWTPRWIPRHPVKVADEIQFYVETMGARNFPFQDLTAIVKKEWIKDFCKEIIRRKLDITWQMPSGTRSEAIDDEVARLLKQSGMISMAYAPESGSETTRQYIKKKMHTEALMASIRSAVKAGLNVAAFIVLGFPHDDEQSVRESEAFVKTLAEEGIEDISVAFYMALPGTELFHSLYRNGRIRIDRSYFRHMLASLSLIPQTSYAEALPLRKMFYWKLRLFIGFYRRKAARKRLGAWFVLRQLVRGMVEIDHQTKLQSALRNGLRALWITLCTRFGKRWISQQEEEKMFADWDDIYRVIDASNRKSGVWAEALSDYTSLHKTNVIARLRHDHERAHSVAVGGVR